MYCRRFLVFLPLNKCTFSVLKPVKKTMAKKVNKKTPQKIKCKFAKMRLGPQHVDFSLFLKAQDGVKNR